MATDLSLLASLQGLLVHFYLVKLTLQVNYPIFESCLLLDQLIDIDASADAGLSSSSDPLLWLLFLLFFPQIEVLGELERLGVTFRYMH
jgi:hypothetical protein